MPAYGESSLSLPDTVYASTAYSQHNQSSTGGPKASQRPPSPTPSELEDADERPFNFINFLNRGKKQGRPSPWTLAIFGVLIIIFILIMVFHSKIIDGINPYAEKLRKLPAGWVIPIALLIVWSFPPLVGAEIIDIMCGVVWGVWKGFLIASAGHLLGEIANWFVFKYFCTGRSEKYESHKLGYACLARVVRESGFWAALVIRYSAIPNHLTTVIFSVVGISFWSYLAASFLSLPNLFFTVYIGVIADQKTESKSQKIISIVVTIVNIVVTIAAGRWIFGRMDAIRPTIVEERRISRAERRAGKSQWMQADGHQQVRMYARGDDDENDGSSMAPLMRESYPEA